MSSLIKQALQIQVQLQIRLLSSTRAPTTKLPWQMLSSLHHHRQRIPVTAIYMGRALSHLSLGYINYLVRTTFHEVYYCFITTQNNYIDDTCLQDLESRNYPGFSDEAL